MVFDRGDMGGDIVPDICLLLGFNEAGEDQALMRRKGKTGFHCKQIRHIQHA